MRSEGVIVSLVERIRLRRHDHRLDICRVVQRVFDEVGLPWQDIAVVRYRDQERYACLISVSSELWGHRRLELAAVRAAVRVWAWLNVEMSAQDFFWRAVAGDGERRAQA